MTPPTTIVLGARPIAVINAIQRDEKMTPPGVVPLQAMVSGAGQRWLNQGAITEFMAAVSHRTQPVPLANADRNSCLGLPQAPADYCQVQAGQPWSASPKARRSADTGAAEWRRYRHRAERGPFSPKGPSPRTRLFARQRHRGTLARHKSRPPNLRRWRRRHAIRRTGGLWRNAGASENILLLFRLVWDQTSPVCFGEGRSFRCRRRACAPLHAGRGG